MIEEVLTLAVTLGKAEKSEELRLLCQAAVEELTGELREGMAPEDCGAAFVLGAAWMALAGLEAGPGGVESFTAGAVSVQMKGGQDAAARRAVLRHQARQEMRPYIRDEGFVFRGVPG